MCLRSVSTIVYSCDPEEAIFKMRSQNPIDRTKPRLLDNTPKVTFTFPNNLNRKFTISDDAFQTLPKVGRTFLKRKKETK